ncbi:MAG: RNA pseudouridine synthase [Oscillospiraceae bacterium]|nr:RNA pseudouridine synthase [Oscillospiraceae bacterium]
MDIIYSDRELAVIVKPVGVDSEHQVPALISETLGGEIFPIHRLDLNVGGVMVYARTKSSAAQLSKLVQEGKLVKEYRCLVHGTPPESGVLEDLLFKDSRKNKVFVVKKERKGVKKASLEYVRLTDGSPALLHIRLHTGRSHQIRVQFASRGFPLVGDHKYGARDEAKEPKLFSCRISFPWKGEDKVFEAFPEWGRV